jgi:hypothetical protein
VTFQFPEHTPADRHLRAVNLRTADRTRTRPSDIAAEFCVPDRAHYGGTCGSSASHRKWPKSDVIHYSWKITIGGWRQLCDLGHFREVTGIARRSYGVGRSTLCMTKPPFLGDRQAAIFKLQRHERVADREESRVGGGLHETLDDWYAAQPIQTLTLTGGRV